AKGSSSAGSWNIAAHERASAGSPASKPSPARLLTWSAPGAAGSELGATGNCSARERCAQPSAPAVIPPCAATRRAAECGSSTAQRSSPAARATLPRKPTGSLGCANPAPLYRLHGRGDGLGARKRGHYLLRELPQRGERLRVREAAPMEGEREIVAAALL